MRIDKLHLSKSLLAINPHLSVGPGVPTVSRRKVVVERAATEPVVRTDVLVEIPGLRLSYTLNSRLHWSERKRVVAHQRAVVTCVLALEARPALPCAVTVTRVGPRSLNDDNATGSAKAVRDAIAAWLGTDDEDNRITWRVEQARGPYAVRIEIRGAE